MTMDVRGLNDAARTLIEQLDRHGIGNLALFEQQVAHLRGHLFSDAMLASEPVPATGNPCPVAGCNALNLHYHGRMQYGPATGNPEGIDVEALARALHEASPASHFRRKCRDDHYLRAEAIAAEYARQREGERP